MSGLTIRPDDPIVADIHAWSTGTIDDDGLVRLFQHLVDTGAAWQLEGAVGRAAMDLLEAGAIMLGPEAHFDHYGNRVPARHEVVPGTVGSPEYVAARS